MSNRPVKTIKLGGIQAAIWEKDGRFSTTFKRTYKTKEGEWKDTTYFAPEDCAIVSVVAAQAAQYMTTAKDQLKTASHGTELPRIQTGEVQAASFGDDEMPF
jgi:hypothetical protein